MNPEDRADAVEEVIIRAGMPEPDASFWAKVSDTARAKASRPRRTAPPAVAAAWACLMARPVQALGLAVALIFVLLVQVAIGVPGILTWLAALVRRVII